MIRYVGGASVAGAMHQGIRLASLIYDAALDPGAWPVALDAVARACGAVGAAYFVEDKASGQVDWISLTGPSVGLETAYVDHFAPLDPFAPVLRGPDTGGSWMWLSECLPGIVGRGDPWYDDFVRRAGVGDILGARVLDTASRAIFIGLHREIGAPPVVDLELASFEALSVTLRAAAQLHHVLRSLAPAGIAMQALDHVPTAVIVTDADGRVLQVNRRADRLLAQGDGLGVHAGRLNAARSFESAKLVHLIAAAVGPGEAAGKSGRMLVARGPDRSPLSLIVAPLGATASSHHRPLALIVIGDPEARLPPRAALAELFSLSPAEARLAAELMTGKTLAACAAGFGVQRETVRTQLRSILRKVGVTRQADLLRVLADVWPGEDDKS
jgi:DNA-binding CsgD family transcriptional regulator/PAS domain-containing protein